MDKTAFIWSKEHDRAFNTIKQMIATAPILRYYNVNDEVTIEADSSDFALGAVLLQEGPPVA